MKHSILIATAAAVVIAGGTAAGVALGDDGPAQRSAETATMGTDPRADTDGTDDGPARHNRYATRTVDGQRITAERAREIALRAHPGRVDEVERDDYRNRAVWEVEIHGEDGVEHEVAVDASTGRIAAQHTDDRDGRDDRDDRDDDGRDDDDRDDDRD